MGRIKGFRLESVVPHGVGGPEAGAINLIYSILLKEFEQDFYRFFINQIGNDLNEFEMKGPGNKIYINIRYPGYHDFETKTVDEKNRIRLVIIHTALLRVAKFDKRLDIHKLELIRDKIIEMNFHFEFTIKKFVNTKNRGLIAKIVVIPQMDKFSYYVVIENGGTETGKLLIYEGGTSLYYFPMFFQKGQWISNNEIIITGKENIVETHVLINENRVEYVNLTPYEKPPLFELMKSDISKEDKKKASKDWHHSLPPHIDAALNYEAN